MKTKHAVALSLVTGLAIGGAVIEAVHAEATPPVYLVAEISVTNPEAYAKEYAAKARASIVAAGGKAIAAGGSGGFGAKRVTPLDGEAPKRVVILRWDSLDKLKAWHDSAAYKEARKVGDKYATFRTYAVDGAQ